MRHLAAVVAWALSAPTFGGAPTVVDIGLASGFQDTFLGHHNRARACVAADFDLDGWIDFYVGNPGDASFVIRNTGIGGDGIVHFELAQVLLDGEVAWGASSADYDNDGDYDLFITCGGNELNAGPCFLFRNLFLETGQFAFEDVTDAAGVRGIVPPGETEPQVAGHSNAVWADYDGDADVDVFVNVNISAGSLPTLLGRNVLWRNNGDGTFTDVTDAVGLSGSTSATQHSTFLDVDNDGDMDLYENNFGINVFFPNVLWLNLLADTGQAVFIDVTNAASAPGNSLAHPKGSFVSAAGDFDNDGWQDILALKRMCATGCEAVYDTGHVLFLNQGFAGFVNVADVAGLNNPYWGNQGVMGSQLGDLNGDGILDVFIGNGQPVTGEVDQLYLSNATVGPVGTIPQYDNASALIDFPAAEDGRIVYPPYPYRTHGSNFVDVDNDGVLELAITNGGTSTSPPIVREPNRLFEFTWDEPFNYLKVRPVGDGVNVSRDAIGTRIAVTVREGAGAPWTVHETLFAGRAFSAQNGFELYFGLAQADTIESMRITWPDGTIQDITQGLVPNTSIVVERTPSVPGDVDGDGVVGFADLSTLLAQWGPCTPCPRVCVGDLDEDCGVGFSDLAIVLAQWGNGR